MPISLDEAFAGALGTQLGVGNDLQDQFDRMSRRLERSGDPLADIGFDVFTVIRDLAGTLQAPPPYVTPVRVTNLGMLELMAVGTYAFAVLIFLKLLRLCWQVGQNKIQLQQVNAQLAVTNNLLEAIAACVCNHLAQLVGVVLQMMTSFSAQLTALMVTITQSITTERKFTVDIGPNLRDLGVFSILALLAGLSTLGPSAAAGLIAIAGALALVAGAIWLVAKALNQMPANSRELVETLGYLAIGLVALGAVIAVFGGGVKGLLTIGLGFAIMAGFLWAVGYALSGMPDNLDQIVSSLWSLFAALGGFVLIFSLLSPAKFKQVGLGFLAMTGFVLGLGIAISLMDKETLDALPGLQVLFDGLIGIVDKLKEVAQLDKMGTVIAGLAAVVFFVGALALVTRLFDAETLRALPGIQTLFDSLMDVADAIVAFDEKDQLGTIAMGFAGVILFLGLLGAALSLFNADTLNALPGLSMLFESLTQLAEKIVKLKDDLWVIAAGMLGIVIFVALLGAVFAVFGEDIALAAGPLAELITSFTSLASTLGAFGIGDLLVMGAGLALIAAFVWAIALAAVFAGPELEALSSVLGSLNTILDGVASAAGAVGDALTSIPSLISLPSLGGVTSGIGGIIDSLATGGPIDQTGNYLLHKGEHVLNAGQVNALEAGRGGMGASSSINVGDVNISLSANSIDQESVGPLSEQIVAQIQSQLRELTVEQQFRSGNRLELS